jgi:hypothetical protein
MGMKKVGGCFQNWYERTPILSPQLIMMVELVVVSSSSFLEMHPANAVERMRQYAPETVRVNGSNVAPPICFNGGSLLNFLLLLKKWMLLQKL